MKFIFQLNEDENSDLHDFVREGIVSARYVKWYSEECHHWLMMRKSTVMRGEFVRDAWFEGWMDAIPVGDLEFVHTFLEKVHDRVAKEPIYIPEALRLRRYLGRELLRSDGMHFPERATVWFTKQANVHKGEAVFATLPLSTPGDYWISSALNFISEWRVFVFNGVIVGLKNYQGDFDVFPNMEIIYDMVESFRVSRSDPKAYTLDVGIESEKKNTYIIEVHPFYSCGLYGFNDYRFLLKMLKSGWDWLKSDEGSRHV